MIEVAIFTYTHEIDSLYDCRVEVHFGLSAFISGIRLEFIAGPYDCCMRSQRCGEVEGDEGGSLVTPTIAARELECGDSNTPWKNTFFYGEG